VGVHTVKTHLKDLLSTNRRYRIAPYQRKYEWSPVQMGRLIDDTMESWRLTSTTHIAPHFIGSFILHDRKTKLKQMYVIDGQQRLTSVSIILAVLRDMVDTDAALRTTLQSYLVEPPADQKSVPFKRLEHHRGGETHFSALVTALGSTKRSHTSVDDEQFERIAANTQIARTKLAHLTTDSDIAGFRHHVMDECEVIEIKIDSNDDAFRIFRTVNGTGQPVRDQDVLRVSLIEKGSAVPATRDKHARYWDKAEKDLGSEGFEAYLRMKRFELAGVFDEEGSLRAGYEDDFKVPGPLLTAFLDALPDDTAAYEAIGKRQAPAGGFGKTYKLEASLHSLNMVDFDEWIALALALYHRYRDSPKGIPDRQNLADWIAKLDRLAWRYHLSSGENYNEKSRRDRFANILKYFRNHAPNMWSIPSSDIDLTNAEKHAMREALRGKIDPKWPILRSVLLRLEQAKGNGAPSWGVTSGYTIEHVLPKSGGGRPWEKALGANSEHTKALARELGNLCFVTNNKALGESLFDVKKPLIQATNAEVDSRLSKDVCAQTAWTEAVIKDRTNRMANAFEKALDL
jgi:hypothetical protein